MGRSRATSWIAAALVFAFGAMGLLRNVHAATHAFERVQPVARACDHDDARPTPSLPAQSPERDRSSCPTCDLLCAQGKTLALADASDSFHLIPQARPLDSPAPAPIDTTERPHSRKTRGPPAAQ